MESIYEINKPEDHIQKKLNKILETRFDNDKETLEALSDLSKFFSENTLHTRRNLRSQIEKRSLAINENFLTAFRGVKLSLDAICDDVDSIANSVNNMKIGLRNTQDQTSELIQQTNTLQEESNKLQIHQEIAGTFLNRFQLTVHEHQILYGLYRDATIDADFFVVLDQVQSIHSDCRILLQSGYQTAALHIMEEMTLHQEAALERLYRWTQNHCRNIDVNEIGILVIQAMSRLQDRPVLFKYVIDEYSTARRAVLVRSFIDALTVGGPNGNPKPIEMHAHDAKRYVGDIFAWLHQAIPTERENLLLLIKLCDKNDLTEQIQTALANISDGICHPLSIRVSMILNAEKDAIVLYSIANLIRFYQNIINHVVRGGLLEETLAHLQTTSEMSYVHSLGTQVKSLLQSTSGVGLAAPENDLVPPQSVGKLLNILKEILSVASMVEGRQTDTMQIVSCVIDPLLQSVTESASHLPTTDMAVYLLNCLYKMQSTLAMYEYMDDRMERLQAQCDAQIDTLTSQQATSLVTNLNLGPIYTVLQSDSAKMEINHLKIFMKKFDSFIEMPEILLLPQVNLLISSTHRSTIQKRSFNVIIAIYKQIYDKVHDSSNEYENIDSVFTRTPEEISELLTG